jgi:hypothetical protein
MDSIMAQSYHNKKFIVILAKLICPDIVVKQNNAFEENIEVNVINIPEEFAHRLTYGKIFDYLLSINSPCIPIAIVRKNNTYENELPYIFSNPNPQAPILVTTLNDYIMNM